MKKTFLFFAALFAVSLITKAQSDPDWVWEQKLESACSGNGVLDIKDITVSYEPPNQTFTGNVYVTGKFRGSITLNGHTLSSEGAAGTNCNNNNYDGFLAQYDLSGNLKWVTKFGKNSQVEEAGAGVMSDLLGNVYLTGYVVPVDSLDLSFNHVNYYVDFGFNLLKSAGLSTPTGIKKISTNTNLSASATIPFIAKFDKNGFVKWVSLVEAPGGRGLSVALSPDFDGSTTGSQTDGDVYMTGYFADYISYPSGNSNCRTPSGTLNAAPKTFVAKYKTLAGNISWANYINNDPNDISTYNAGRAVTVEGDFIDPFTLQTVSKQDVYVVGDYRGTAVADYAYDATTHSTVSRALPTPSGIDGMVLKLDHSTGLFLWERTVSSSGDDFITGADMYPRYAELYIIGDYPGNSTLTLNGTSSSATTSGSSNGDVFVGRYDWNGDAMWATTLASSGIDHGTDIIAFNETANDLHIAGTYQSDITDAWGQTLKKVTGGSTHNSFVAKLDRSNGYTYWADGIDASFDAALYSGPRIAYERSSPDYFYMGGMFKTAETPDFVNSLSTSQISAGYVASRRNCNCPTAENVQVLRDNPMLGQTTVMWTDPDFAACNQNYFIQYTELMPPFNQQMDGPYMFGAGTTSNPIATNTTGDPYEWIIVSDCGYGQVNGDPIFMKNGPLNGARTKAIITEGNAKNEVVKLYPNPVASDLTIDGKFTNGQDGIMSIEITDVLGRTVKNVTFSNATANHTLSVADLSTGVYTVVVSSTNNIYSFKITKE